MYNDSGGSSNPKRLLIILLVALFLVIGGTILLNGGTSTEMEVNDTNDTVENQTIDDVSQVNSTLLGNTTWGTVTKMGPYGNTSSDVHIAYVIGVNQKDITNNSFVPTLESRGDLKYSYDIYMINASNDDNANGGSNTSSNMSLNDKSQLLAKEFATQDIINKKYDCCVDVHSADDSNSYMFVASDDTVTSKKLVDHITDSTGIGVYVPEGVTYTDSVSIPVLESNIPSIVYVTKEFYSNEVSGEISDVITAIDNFIFNSGNSSTQSSNTSDVTYQSSNNTSSVNSSADDSNQSNVTVPTIPGNSVNDEVD